MNKSEFLKRVHSDNELFYSNVYDKIVIAEKANRVMYTSEFCTPDIWKKLKELQSSLGIIVSYDGIFNSSERKIIAFSNEEVYEFPLKLMKIHNKSKFTSVSHRDYMGAIMSLGIARGKLGDFVVASDSCYVAVCEDISDYIINNLTSIGKNPCTVEECNTYEIEVPDISFEAFNLIVSSLRLDCVVSEICKISRSRALELINSGSVLLNYMPTREKSVVVKYEDTITIRGFGKYKLQCSVGTTSKQRIKIIVKKFV